MTTNMITAANVQTAKFQVNSILGFNKIYSLDAIEDAMSFFDYESEEVEGIVFNFMRSELHRKAEEAAKFLAA